MTPSEFKAWFEGFTEAFSGVPTRAQWTRVKERVAEIDGKPVTEKIFIDRYWPQYFQNYPYIQTLQPLWGCRNTTTTSLGNNTTHLQNHTAYTASNAMYALGKADAQSLTAGGK